MREILTLADVAKRLQCSESMIRKEAACGRIPAFRIGKLWRFDADELDRWIEEGIHGKATAVHAGHGRN